jgi:[ribosomal protein S5]-alanine N-acetyltransferase
VASLRVASIGQNAAREDLSARALHDGDVALRPLRSEDAAAYAGAFRDDPDLGRLLGIETDPDEAEVRERIESQVRDEHEPSFVKLAIADAVTDAFWGVFLVHSLAEQHRRGEIGFWVVPEQRRRRVGSRAVALSLAWQIASGTTAERVSAGEQ